MNYPQDAIKRWAANGALATVPASADQTQSLLANLAANAEDTEAISDELESALDRISDLEDSLSDLLSLAIGTEIAETAEYELAKDRLEADTA